MWNPGGTKTSVVSKSVESKLLGMRMMQSKVIENRSVRRLSSDHYSFDGTVRRAVVRGGHMYLEALSVAFDRARAGHGDAGGAGSVKKLVTEARKAGKQYLLDQIQSDHFQHWIMEQIGEAESKPADHWLINTSADAKKFAKNALQQLGWDTSRDMGTSEILDAAGAGHMRNEPSNEQREIVKAFMEGFNGARESASVVKFVAEEARERTNEHRENSKRRASMPNLGATRGYR